MPDPVLVDLAAETRELAASKEHLERQRLWTALLDLEPVRPLVNYYMYPRVWARDIAPGSLRHTNGIEAVVELQLRCRLWQAKHYPDDTPLLPVVWVDCARPPRGPDWMWGVELLVERTSEDGSYRPVPPIQKEADIAKVRPPRYQEDNEGSRRLVNEVCERIDGILPVKTRSDELHWGPFEYVVRLRGLENLLFDLYERPEFVRALMQRVTDGMIAYQQEREAAGAVDAMASWFGHVPCHHHIPAGEGHLLKRCWAYIHAQSSASISPDMYAAFIHPYNKQLAALVGLTYYHGCEDLGQKCRIIQDLPGLRLFHVSPWTPVDPVVHCLGNTCVLEVHSHPTNVLWADSRDQVVRELRERHKAVQGIPHVLALADVETARDRVEALIFWAETARGMVA